MTGHTPQPRPASATKAIHGLCDGPHTTQKERDMIEKAAVPQPARHTPGPWTAHDDGMGALGIVKGDGIEVCDCSASGLPDIQPRPTPAEATANARLIAAAPALLEALRGLLRQVEHDLKRQKITKASQAEIVARAALAAAGGVER